MKVRTYMGVFIERADINSSGIRWTAFVQGAGTLKADTLQGIKQLIKHTLASL